MQRAAQRDGEQHQEKWQERGQLHVAPAVSGATRAAPLLAHRRAPWLIASAAAARPPWHSSLRRAPSFARTMHQRRIAGTLEGLRDGGGKCLVVAGYAQGGHGRSPGTQSTTSRPRISPAAAYS